MRTRDLIWYDVGLVIGTVVVAGAALARRLTGRAEPVRIREARPSGQP